MLDAFVVQLPGRNSVGGSGPKACKSICRRFRSAFRKGFPRRFRREVCRGVRSESGKDSVEIVYTFQETVLKRDVYRAWGVLKVAFSYRG